MTITEVFEVITVERYSPCPLVPEHPGMRARRAMAPPQRQPSRVSRTVRTCSRLIGPSPMGSAANRLTSNSSTCRRSAKFAVQPYGPVVLALMRVHGNRYSTRRWLSDWRRTWVGMGDDAMLPEAFVLVDKR